MPYWISLMADTEGGEPTEVFRIDGDADNVSPMWRAALGYPLGDLDGFTAERAVEEIALAVERLRSAPNRYVPFNPVHRWGGCRRGLVYLETLAAMCVHHPKTTIDMRR